MKSSDIVQETEASWMYTPPHGARGATDPPTTPPAAAASAVFDARSERRPRAVPLGSLRRLPRSGLEQYPVVCACYSGRVPMQASAGTASLHCVCTALPLYVLMSLAVLFQAGHDIASEASAESRASDNRWCSAA